MTEPIGNSRAAVDFLLARPGFPVVSCVWIDANGKKGLFETTSWPRRAVDRDKLTAWIEERQGKANIYYSVNPPLAPVSKKMERTDLKSLVSLHVDLDPRVGEDQDAAQARLVKQLSSLKQPPTWIINSGGGVQGIWDLVEPVPIGGSLDVAEDLKMYNIQLERELGGDNCHNVDRIMRVPGTINVPDERKLKKGRRPALAYIVQKRETAYNIGDFSKAAPLQDAGLERGARGAGSADRKVDLPTNIDRIINLDDDEHFVRSKDWIKRCICFGKDPEGLKVWSSRSEMVWAVVCELVRQEVPDDKIVAVLTDPDWLISQSILEKKNVDRELKRVIGRAHEYAEDSDLATMNDEHAVVTVGSKTRVMSWEDDDINAGHQVPFYRTFDDFRNFMAKYRKTFLVHDKDSGETKEKSVMLGDWWLGNPRRRQFNGVKYMPYSDDEVVKGCLNLWTGFTRAAIKSDKHESFLAHIRDNLCSGNEEYSEYLLNWMAHVVQRRSGPAGVAVVLKSESEGTGKSFFAKSFGALFGRHFKHITNADHLIGKFNSHLQDCQVLFADEAFFANDKKHSGLLKTIITEETMMVEKKGIDATASRNYVALIMASNLKFVVPAGMSARRYFVLEVSIARLQDSDYFAAIQRDLDAGGYEALMAFLMARDISAFQIRNVPKTAALMEQKSMTRAGIDALIENLATSGQLPCSRLRHPDVTITTGDRNGKGFWNWVRDNHGDLRYQQPAAMLASLRHDWGCGHYKSNGEVGIRFPPLRDLRTAFESRHGAQDWNRDGETWLSQAETAGTPVDRDDIPF